MPDEPDGDFESPLDELFVEGARYKEPSAAERKAWAKKSHAASKRRKRKERRARRSTNLRRYAPAVLLVVLTVAVYALFIRGSSDGEPLAGPDTVQVVYATPNDVPVDDELVDAIRNEIAVVDEWFDEQAGRTPNWADDDGVVTVETRALNVSSTVLLERPDAGQIVADEFRDEEGELPADELFLVFVPVANESLCGEAGQVVVIWVGACGDAPSNSTSELTGGVSGTIAHEVIHAMGAVAPCAPNYGNNGHVTDDPTDIMYDPLEGGRPRATSNLVLDPGRDDYYDHGDNDCADINDSPLWD